MEKNTNLKDFEIISRLGQGAFGQVFKIKRKADGEVYALKKIKTVTMNEKDKLNALNQVRILASYQGQHIIGYKQSFYDDVSGCLCIVLQFAQQGDVFRKINNAIKTNKRIEQPQIWKALVHITKGIRSLHVNKVLHRDLKCANIFIMNDGTYKLGDLNISKVLKKQLAVTQTGTPYYCSPEVWKNKPYGIKSDMWSLGCVLYQMCALKPPFTANDLQGLFRKVCAGCFPRIPTCYSNQLSDVINSLLKQNPILRPDTQQLLSNPAVLQGFRLLQTIKLNQRNWKKLNLPKAKYNQDTKLDVIQQNQGNQSKQKVRSYNMERPASGRQSKKTVQQINKDKVKLNNYLDSSRSNKQKQKQQQLHKLSEQIKSIEKKRERVLSACGANRINRSIHQSPRKNQVVKQEAPASMKGSRKDSQDRLKLPPKPKAVNPRDNNNNLLPPKPTNMKKDSSRKSLDRNQSKQNLKREQQLLKCIQNEIKVPQIDQKTVKKKFLV